MPHWSDEKIAFAEDLRAKGYSLVEIHWRLCALFGPTSYSRTWHYVKDIPIDPEYQAHWEERMQAGGSAYKARLSEKEAQEKASAILAEYPLTLREFLLIAAMLYWGEGTKRELSVTNTDANLLVVFIDCLNKALNIPRDRFRFALRIFEDLDHETCIQYWCQALNLKREQLTTVSVLKGKKKGKLQYGMCRIRFRRGKHQLKLLRAVIFKIGEVVRAPIVQGTEQGSPNP